MASARIMALSTAAAVKIARRMTAVKKQWKGIPPNKKQWKGIPPNNNCHRDLSTAAAVKQWKGITQWPSNNQSHRDLSTAVKWRGIPQWPKDPFTPNTRHTFYDIGYTVDVADLLFTPERDFLVKNNGRKIKVDDLRGKTIVLFIVPLDAFYDDGTKPGEGDTVYMIDAYSELLRMGSDIEFVFVPVRLYSVESVDERLSQEALFDHLFSTMPFPAIPFSYVRGPEGPVVQTFSIDRLDVVYHSDDYETTHGFDKLPYWVVIDPTNKVVATRHFNTRLFKSYGGAELYPLSRQRISALAACRARDSRVECISKWDQLLASDTRDYLLSSNGDKVPISSLKGKLVGLYFCENIPHPPRMQVIKKVYEKAKSRGYDFEIVQITFHYHPINAKHLGIDPTIEQCREDVSWLTLPFKDPSCRKIHRILDWAGDGDWVGDSLALIYPCDGVLYEFSGAEILERWGIEGYPFTRSSLYKAEYELQKRKVTLQSLFPLGEILLCRPRPAGDGYDLVDAFSQLSGKRVLVLFAPHDYEENKMDKVIGKFISMLKCKYEAQVEDNVAEESKFEVVYVSTACYESSFDEITKHMPWLVRPYSEESHWDLVNEVFETDPYVDITDACAAAFNEQGELIAKDDDIREKKKGVKLRFPFIDREVRVRREVEALLASFRS